jgi:Tfp pilus assembly ATPase PilU
MISEEEALRNADSVNNLRLKIKLDGDSLKSTTKMTLHE